MNSTLRAGFPVCSNGAVLIAAATGRIVEQVGVDLFDPVAVLRERLPGAVFVAENAGVGVHATARVDDADIITARSSWSASMNRPPRRPLGWLYTGPGAAAPS
jgi:hypothetical protein